MDSTNPRGPAKAPSTPGGAQPQATQRGPPSAGAAAPGVPLARYSSANQLPPIQSPMSPKADRPYMPPMAHGSPAGGSSVPARAASSYASGSLSAHSQASYAVQDMSPNPSGGAGPVPAPLHSGPGPYVRSPPLVGAQAPGVPAMKGTVQPHAASSPLPGHGAASVGALDEGPVSAPTYPLASTTPVPRMPLPQGLASPSARPATQPHPPPPAQSSHPLSVPPLKQAQSPRMHRTASTQSTPLPPHAQQSPRAMGPGSAAHPSSVGSAAGSTFVPKSSSIPAAMATAAVPPLGPAHSMGTVARPPSTMANNAQPPPSSGLAITGTSAAGSTGAAASAPVSAASAAAEPAPRQQSQTEVAGRPLNVSDALSYLDMVKSQFHDRPEVYNQFLEIMKEFKSHAIDTPGVISRVSRLFYGSPALIQGFNTFLPPGYRIECSDDPTGGVRVTTPSGSIIPDMQRQGSAGAALAQSPPPPPPPASGQPAGQRGPQAQQAYVPRDQYAARRSAQAPQAPQAVMQPAASGPAAQLGAGAYAGGGAPAPAPAAAAAVATAQSPGAMRSPSTPSSQRSRGVPVEFNHAITYVNKIKMRFAAEPDRYKEFLEILQTYQKESRPIHEVYAQVQLLFSSAPDLLDEFKQFLPDTSEPGTGGGALAGMGIGSPLTAYARAGAGAAAAGSGMAQGQYAHTGGAPAHGMGAAEAMATGRLPPVGNFAPTGGHAVDPFSGAPSGAPGAGASYDSKMPATTPGASRKRRGVMTGGPQAVGSTSAKRRTKGPKGDGAAGDGPPGYGTPGPQPGGPQQLANPASATSEELAFFERAKRFIGQPSAYNEFLKLLNLFNQQVLDPKTLVERAESFIGDDHELFGWFKQFVGFDDQQRELDDARSGDEEIVESLLGPEPTPYMPPEEAAKTLRPARPKVDLMQCKAYGPSYRLLPDAATRAKCSGRDAMCYEVLNDRWASHPTWASEDTEFVHHKKNQFEEAMFRSEEDRHEMDIEIDTNLSVIRQLTPLAQQIEQMDPEKQMQLTLPENFLSMSEALPRRVLRRVYDSGRALEIIKAMHTHPAVAIPIVLKRLKQKDEEWRRQRREFSKIWRETDERNYYRALDHQGLTFKATDRKLTSPKHLFAEIEARRREQQNLLAYESTGAQRQSRKVASALRHRYQLEYQFSEPTVLADVINAILAHVGRQNSQFAPSEKEMMERFFHDLFGGLFGVERGEQSHVSAPSDRDESNSDDGDDGEAKPTEKPAAATNGHAANGAAAVSGAPAAQDAEAEAAATPASNAMDVDDKAEPAVPGESGASAPEANGADAAPADGKDNGAATKAAAASPRAEDGSKPSTPGLISSRSWIQLGSAARDQSVAASTAGTATKSLSRAFYANSNYYMFLRLFQILYERFNRLRELGPECQSQATQPNQAQSAATKLGLRPQLEVFKAYDMERTEYYAVFLEVVDQFLQGQLDANTFEEAVRFMYGINAYRILTVDKVVQAIAKNIQSLVSDARSIDILELFTSLPPVHEQSPLRSHIAYRMKVEALVGADEHVFRVDYIYESQTMTIQLLRREDITLDEAVTEEERWAYYVDSYVLFEPTEGVPQLQQSRPRPYLRRHLHADECDYVISSRSNLEIKIAVNTYKLCFLTGTEDTYANHTRRAQLAGDAAAKAACDEQWGARAARWHSWLEQEHGRQQQAAAPGDQQLNEWWK